MKKFTLDEIRDAVDDLTVECICHPDVSCRISADADGNLSIKSGVICDSETVIYENYFPMDAIELDDGETLEEYAQNYICDMGVDFDLNGMADDIYHELYGEDDE